MHSSLCPLTDFSKILSTITSYFTSVYVMQWATFFPDTALKYPPSFDGRIIAYPSAQHVRDYFAWRQADSTFCGRSFCIVLGSCSAYQ